jgi:alpha-tubulin suppressor-like RCC1 family protein
MTTLSDTPRVTPARRLAARGLAAGAAALAILAATAGSAAATAGPGTGFLVAWGSNASGQLGDGTTTNQDAGVVVQLKKGTVITSVRSGCIGSIALTRGGQVLDWGFGGDGALGNGARKNSSVPVQVRLAAGTKVTAVRAGCDFNLALTAAGRVLTWGIDPASLKPDVAAAPGRALPGRALPGHALPVQVRFPAGTRVTGISAGTGFALALTSTGQVYAWGRNDNGQLGNGRFGPGTGTPVRVRLPAGIRVSAIAAGEDHALARTTAGGVLAWGNGQEGSLGNGDLHTNRARPVHTKLPAGTRVRGLFAGCNTGYVLTAAGRVLGWGADDNGQLADGTQTPHATPVEIKLPMGAKATAISAGCAHALALTSGGVVYAWGRGGEGQVGNGDTRDSFTPVRVQIPPGALAIGSGPSADSSLAIVPAIS